MRQVLIATPALDGRVDAWFVNSLVFSIKAGLAAGIEFCPVSLINESILPMARNELLHIALTNEFESVVFIDSDQGWEPKYLIDIVNSEYDVVGLPVVSKSDQESYNVRFDPEILDVDEQGYIRVSSVGTGFLKISKKALTSLAKKSKAVEFRGKKIKKICEYGQDGSDFVGEDINLCKKLTKLGYNIWINPAHTAFHVGNKVYVGNFAGFLERIRSTEE